MIPMIDEERKKEKGMARIVKVSTIYRRTYNNCIQTIPI